MMAFNYIYTHIPICLSKRKKTNCKLIVKIVVKCRKVKKKTTIITKTAQSIQLLTFVYKKSKEAF